MKLQNCRQYRVHTVNKVIFLISCAQNNKMLSQKKCQSMWHLVILYGPPGLKNIKGWVQSISRWRWQSEVLINIEFITKYLVCTRSKHITWWGLRGYSMYKTISLGLFSKIGIIFMKTPLSWNPVLVAPCFTDSFSLLGHKSQQLGYQCVTSLLSNWFTLWLEGSGRQVTKVQIFYL